MYGLAGSNGASAICHHFSSPQCLSPVQSVHSPLPAHPLSALRFSALSVVISQLIGHLVCERAFWQVDSVVSDPFY